MPLIWKKNLFCLIDVCGAMGPISVYGLSDCAIRHKPRKNMGGGACSVSVRVDATRKLVVE